MSYNFQPSKIIEYSQLLEYAIAHCENTDTFVIFAPVPNNTIHTLVNRLINLNPQSLIMLVNDEDRAKALCDNLQWHDLIDLIQCNK